MASSKVHYKMYKKGKALVFCSIATIAIASVVTSIDTSNSYASAAEVSLTNNTENSSDNTTTTVPFDQSLLPLNTYNYDQIENLSLSEANQMAASRFFYGNFKSWYRSGNDWGDDRSQDIVGSATATFGPSQYSTSPKSRHSFAFNSPDDNSGFQWSANLMPNTNYTLNFASLGFGISNPNARIVILDASGKTLASMTNLKTGDMDVQNLKFSTGSTPDTNDMYSRITVQILGKFEKQQLNGDISATANTPVISPETKSGTKKYYKVSDYTNQKLSSIIMGKNHDSVYQFEDTANNNSRIVPTYSGYTDQTIDENSISDVSQTFNFTAQSPQKWGVTGGSASYAVVLLNDVKVTNDLENEAHKITANINGDSNLTSEEKHQQLAALNLALSNAKTAVSNANTDTEMASAKNDGISNIDAAHKPGTSLDDQKASALADLQKEHDKIVAAINADPTLTADQKKAQSANADKALSDAQSAVNNATTADDINKAATAGKTAIDAAYKPGSSLDDQKASALADLQKEHDKIVAAINADPTLTADQKKAQSANADKALSDAQSAVNNATTADDINKAVTAGKTAIDAAHKPGTSLDDQKASALADLQKEHDKIVAAINADPTLTADQKKAQSANADKALSDAQSAVNNATTADDINKAVTAGKTAIDAAHKPGTSLDDQKASALADLQKEHDKIVAAINADPTLTADQKKAQSANADKALSDAQSAVNNATTADDINKAATAGKTAIDAAYKPGSSLDDQKASALADLQKEHDKIVAAINADPTLTADQKKAQSANADKALSDAQSAVNNATTADDINKAVTAGKTAIDAAHKPGSSLDDQKASALADLQKEHDKIVAAINADPTLTADQKKAQSANADKALSDAQSAVNNATTADDINKAATAGKTAIDAAYKPGSSLDDQKASALADLQKEHDKIVAAINADPTLTADQKKAQSANADKALSDAQSAVNNATTADDINKAVTAGKTAIDAAHKPGTSLDDQKASALADLQKEHDKIVAAINADPTLTADQKKAQSANADKALSDAQSAVNNATTADDINKAATAGKTAIDAAYKPGSSLDDQKASALADLQKEHDKIVAAINADPTLTADQKKAQSANADKALSDAQSAVNNATTADDINKAATAGKTAIDAAYKPGSSLDDQKASALADVKEHKESVSLPATGSNRIESITGVIVATLISFMSILGMSILGVKNLKRTKK